MTEYNKDNASSVFFFLKGPHDRLLSCMTRDSYVLQVAEDEDEGCMSHQL